ncbi:hypothetical protein Ancab_014470 [Ancistrocladus abbreviatus]
MASEDHLIHFVMVPFLAYGHMIPMIDMSRVLARHGVTVTIVTTPLNAAKFSSIIDRDAKSGLRIQILDIPFPCFEAGLPEGCESMDMLPSKYLVKNFLAALGMLQERTEQLLHQLKPRISCIVADDFQSWTAETARRFKIPFLVFDGTSCFSLLCTHNILASKVHETVSELEPFVVPGLPDQIVLTRTQLPHMVASSNASDMRAKMTEAQLSAYGVVVNSFQELEQAYVNELQKLKGGKVWCIGPVSLCNEDELDKAERGNKASIGKDQCLKWLDSQEPCSVVYASLGSFSRLKPAQLMELGAGLEVSNRPFIWVIRGGNNSDELEQWLIEERFEERTKGRGLLVRGWAPQVLILSHPAIGGFLTHCGWNSTLEGISAGVPMITWPLFAEQFYNEKMIVQVLRIGLRIGAECSIGWGDVENLEALIKREDVKKAVDELMDKGEEAEGRRKRAKELGKMANMAIDEGGSSFLNMKLLIQDIKQQIGME